MDAIGALADTRLSIYIRVPAQGNFRLLFDALDSKNCPPSTAAAFPAASSTAAGHQKRGSPRLLCWRYPTEEQASKSAERSGSRDRQTNLRHELFPKSNVPKRCQAEASSFSAGSCRSQSRRSWQQAARQRGSSPGQNAAEQSVSCSRRSVHQHRS
mmetsp:Transcript_9700/g.19052  ORF Transcript_9700/g.19052 Transcript_9700/m.19052 type:complete len:156 (+) Transcript_9700:85-552(+)